MARTRFDVYQVRTKEKNGFTDAVKRKRNIMLGFNECKMGRESLHFSDGHEVPIITDRNYMDGYLDWLTLNEGMFVFVFEGWAADLVENQPASDVLIFKGEKLVWHVAPNYKREDVVKAFNRPTLLHSGYRAVVPLRILQSHSGDVSVVAISENKRAFRTHIKDIHQELIRKTLSK